MEEVLRQYKDLLIQKRYSQNTQDIYCCYFKDFCIYFRKEELKNITTAEINLYILDLIKSKNISISQQNQRINAIKFYYEKVLERKIESLCFQKTFCNYYGNITKNIILNNIFLKDKKRACILQQVLQIF